MVGRLVIAVVMGLALVSSALAGWVTQSTTTYSVEEGMPPETSDEQTMYLQNNKLKTVNVGDQTIIFDVDKGEMMVLIPERKVYFSGKPEDIMNAAKTMVDKMKQAMMAQMTPEQRKAYEQYMEQPQAEAAPKKKREVKKTNEQTTIAGYPATKYEVWVNGELDEELWITTKVKLSDEIDVDAVSNMMKAMGTAGEEPSFQMTEEYMELMRQGAPLRTVHYENGQRRYVEETTSIQKKDIPASEFMPPGDYRKLTMEEAMGHMMGGGE
jgi:hypothetical protein